MNKRTLDPYRTRDPEIAALRALRDLRVVRAAVSNPGYARITRKGWATERRLTCDATRANFYLTDEGRREAAITL